MSIDGIKIGEKIFLTFSIVKQRYTVVMLEGERVVLCLKNDYVRPTTTLFFDFAGH